MIVNYSTKHNPLTHSLTRTSKEKQVAEVSRHTHITQLLTLFLELLFNRFKIMNKAKNLRLESEMKQQKDVSDVRKLFN